MEIVASDVTGARAAVFRTRSGKAMATPSLIYPCDNGTIPHLIASTIALIKPCGGYGAYYTALESYLPIVSDGSFQADSLSSHLHPDGSPLREAISFYGLRPGVPTRHYRNSKQAVAAQLNNGSVYRVTPEDYAEAAKRVRPDVLIPIVDLEPQSEHSFDITGGDKPETFLKRRSRRNLAYLKTILTTLRLSESCSIFGFVDDEVENLLKMNCDIDGFVIPVTEKIDVARLMAKLPQDKSRLAMSISSFQDVVTYLRTGIDFFESSWIIDMSNKGMAFDYRSGEWLSLKDDAFIEDLSHASSFYHR